jgi:FKBP-type peptidyl-prolyl cis-trans isomerase FkpA
MKMKHLLGLAAVLFVVLVTACHKNKDKDDFDTAAQAAKDEELIKLYIDTAKLTGMVRDSTGLYYKILEHGTGTDTMILSSKMKVSYTGKLLNGNVFEKADSTTLGGLMLMNLIKGWQYGLRKTTAGGRMLMIIPSGLAYGRGSRDSIPANSVLVFDMKLIDVYRN